MKIKSITVFCGSSEGTVLNYKTVATELGKLLAKENTIGLWWRKDRFNGSCGFEELAKWWKGNRCFAPFFE